MYMVSASIQTSQSSLLIIEDSDEDFAALNTIPVVFPALVKSQAHFARKFDIGVDSGVLDLIDRAIAS
jgi:hypothetical protein